LKGGKYLIAIIGNNNKHEFQAFRNGKAANRHHFFGDPGIKQSATFAKSFVTTFNAVTK
jgi:hypothetical protein